MSVKRPRVVFDCNIYLQAIANAEGPSGRAFALVEKNLIDVVVSRTILAELRAVLKYHSVRLKLPALNDARIEKFMARLLFRGTLIRSVPHIFDYPRAKQDEPYIDLAAAADASFLVTRDTDLQSLSTDHTGIGKEFRQRFPKLRIMNPVAFLSVMAE